MRLIVKIVVVAVGLASVGCSNADDEQQVVSSTISAAPTTSSTVSTPGAVDERPPYPSDGVNAVPMAFDVDARLVVALPREGDTATHTWTFDVDMNTWTQHAPLTIDTGMVYRRLMYDTALRAVALIGDTGQVWTYDVAADQWNKRADGPPDSIGGPFVAARDARSGHLVTIGADGSSLRVWSFDPATNAWAEIQQSGGPTSAALMAFDPAAGGFVVVTSSETWTLDASTGTWTPAGSAPALGFGYGPWGSEMVYQAATDHVVSYSDGVTAEFDAATRTWSTLATPDPLQQGAQNRLGGALVYDASHQRVLLYNGEMWAYDPVTRQWSMLPPATTG